MKSALVVCGLLLFAAQVRRAPPDFHPIGESGAQEAMLHVEPLPIIGGQLEIRMIGIGQNSQLVLPTDNEVALEVRTGDVIVTTNGERQEHTPGDIWVVPMNARVTIAASGEASVLRAMYLIRNSRASNRLNAVRRSRSVRPTCSAAVPAVGSDRSTHRGDRHSAWRSQT